MNNNENDEHWMRLALDMADKAKAEGEVPVGAVLVKNNALITSAWNQPIQHHDPSAHAEINVIRQAGLINKNYRLPDTTLYVTLEPCPMCAGAIIHARIKRLVFAAFDPKSGAAGSVFDLLMSEKHNHSVEVTGGVLETEAASKLKAFFKSRRKLKISINTKT